MRTISTYIKQSIYMKTEYIYKTEYIIHKTEYIIHKTEYIHEIRVNT